MRLLAEEKRSGTLELLLTRAITDRQVVSGKFFSTLLLILTALAFTLPYVITISAIGNMDTGAVICGYIGLILMSGAYISIGLWASSLTQNQIVAYLVALFASFFFHLLAGVIGSGFTGFIGQLFNTLSMQTHFSSISRGVIDTTDLIYFFSIIVLGSFLSEVQLAKRNLSN